ncbi:MAG: cytochrome c [Rhodospirillaceae bacterium]|jgi:mono/diheme cytochrome c family protein|nr:cytochrome c [Rhodospirillaceae bacterium]MBT3808255.1 cytochrome c [Rhodospirillaceae bacterium]MBT3930610.1 cytochrome c [Rhodospirillaceae bacterium]MBT4771586.1 cytochrome c [Rhodospirillaceae bacterium]MBT5357828.1 cytochrome c [Rhodospirillaceae bacterium]
MATSKAARKHLTKLIGLAAILAVGAAAYVAFDGGAIDDNSQASNQADQSVERGQQVYVANCAACHGAKLEGQPNWRTRNANGRLPAPPHDASGHTWHHDDQTLFNLTKYGLSALVGRPIETDMPAYDGKLSDDEIWAALAFIRSQWPKKIQDRQAAMTTQR